MFFYCFYLVNICFVSFIIIYNFQLNNNFLFYKKNEFKDVFVISLKKKSGDNVNKKFDGKRREKKWKEKGELPEQQQRFGGQHI